MADARTETEALLADKPQFESQLEDILAVDEANGTWTFEDVPLDSGAFGELVSRGIVEDVDGEYALADRAAVRRALDGDSDESAGDESATSAADLFRSVEIDRLEVVGVAAALALVVVFRLFPIRSVFQDGDVVLSANDPYAYRYLVHEALAGSSNPFDLSVLSSLPGGVAHGEPLMVATLWWVSALLGGESAVGGVLAWFPVVSAVVTGLLVYALTVRVTEDKRAGIAAVALLAVTPAHAFRTGLGFADHHAFDYPWLALTALAVVALVGRDIRERRTWAWISVLGVGVAGQMLAWDAGPLLLVPIGLYAVAAVPSWLRDGQSPLVAGAPLLAGVALGTLVAVGAHLSFGWHTQAVIVAPVLLSVGIAALLAVGEGARRGGFGARRVAAVEVVGAVAGVVLLRSLVPAFATELERGVNFLLTTEGIAETTSIVSGNMGTVAGPILLFGLVLFLALGHMGWAAWTSYRRHSPAWLAVGVYAWYFLLLSAIQVRFAGQLALFTALFGGLGFVHLAAWVDLASVPAPFESADESSPGFSSEPSEDEGVEWPERREALHVGALGLGVASLGGLLTPIRHSQLTIDDSMYEAAQFMREYSEERDWEYPENYVFSQWGRNRVYNWFVNGESRSYGYAQSNFEDFMTASDGTEWYHRLRDDAGFVVVEDGTISGANREGTIYEHLWSENLAFDTDHYRLVWSDDGDSRRVFTPVSGATITGPASDGETISIEGEATAGDRTTQISRDVDTAHGVYTETIPLPGRYDIGPQQVTLSEADVTDGAVVSEFEREGIAHWSFEEGSGEWAYDRAGGKHAQLHGGEWSDRGIELAGEGYLQAPSLGTYTISEFSISAWIRPETAASGGILSLGKDGGGNSVHGLLFDHGLSGWHDDRLGLYVGDGDVSQHESSPKLGFSYPVEEFCHVAIVFESGELRWFADGKLFGEESLAISQISLQDGRPIYLGREYSGYGGQNVFRGGIDGVSYYEKALSTEEIRSL